MRTSIRLLGVTAAAAAMLAMGSPAFASGGHGKGGKDDHSVTASEAQGGNGKGGNGGLGVNLICGIGVLGKGSCDAANGGSGVGGDADSSAYSED
ncbi:hypothetical protein AB0L13_28335 [Saccharopolyspora shandongensis]|uniref:hypothetical protein n=1 Tax=Saccharopolyspora shandongensis TaxID=418495 RepID=UPI003432C811